MSSKTMARGHPRSKVSCAEEAAVNCYRNNDFFILGVGGIGSSAGALYHSYVD